MTIQLETMTMPYMNRIQQKQSSNPIDSNRSNDSSMIGSSSSSSNTTVDSGKSISDDKSPFFPVEQFKPLPSILVDFFALTICDFLPMRPIEQRTAPELMYFIQKITFHARISCHIAVVALIYIERCKSALPKNAIGDQASKYLHGTKWGSSQQLEADGPHDMADEDRPHWLTNQRMSRLCGNMYTNQQINELERSFLSLIQYQCWVDDMQVQDYLVKHRQELLL
ncbi:hypothetical protein [Absidia glauca]|uniref:Cyclin N-terminal domain-containing protein n=1 Tax=Absidia glauca TaxID=4829 RepID=A0A163K453_ABSGL|nr:hypothetical protein [Absidia glauca]